jgi:hypothetical protein
LITIRANLHGKPQILAPCCPAATQTLSVQWNPDHLRDKAFLEARGSSHHA